MGLRSKWSISEILLHIVILFESHIGLRLQSRGQISRGPNFVIQGIDQLSLHEKK